MKKSRAPSCLFNNSSPLVSIDCDSNQKRRRVNAKNIKIEGNFEVENRNRYRTMFIDSISNFFSNEKEKHENIIQNLLTKPFKVPLPGYVSSVLRPLGLRHSTIRCSIFDPYAEGALVLYNPPQFSAHETLKINSEEKLVHVVVDPLLSKILRPHQREGVKFLYDCVTGARLETAKGCIMADEMGLGKTLQCIALLWTLLKQSPKASPTVSKAIIVCPSSLVKNWDREVMKWLGGRINCLAVDSGSKDQIDMSLRKFAGQFSERCATPVLIISYETFRLHVHAFSKREIGILICDEGHRLKNSDNLTYQALSTLNCERRILISGTPIQNDLLEYYSLINFVNPGLLGTASEFKRQFENIILRGRDADATEEQRNKGDQALAEMAAIVNRFIIRRTSSLLVKYLPIKYELIVCCKLTEVQEQLYRKIISRNKFLRDSNDEKHSMGMALKQINDLKKLCNHPQLLFDKHEKDEDDLEECKKLFVPNFKSTIFEPALSGKMKVLDFLLAITRKTTKDKFVLVSNYTQTIDSFVQLCKLRNYPYVRLDGSSSIKQRAKIVEQFNNPESSEFIFLLSSKAGGCGLNLIGANRLVMFDPDWNPANDDQAMARIWRDGQKKHCFIYRLLSRGTIEEKIFQRQTHKKALSCCVVDEASDTVRHFSKGELRQLFELRVDIASDTHEKLKCNRCINGMEYKEPSQIADTNSDLGEWFHSQKDVRKIPDQILKSVIGCGEVTFVFHQKSHDEKH